VQQPSWRTQIQFFWCASDWVINEGKCKEGRVSAFPAERGKKKRHREDGSAEKGKT